MATQIRVTTQEDSVNDSRVVYLDLSDSQPITANYQFKDIQDFKSNKGNHTFNFRIPSTPNNDLFFGNYFEVTQFGNYNPKKKVGATISKDTFDVFEGYLQLTNVFVSNDVTHHYECVVFSSVSTLGQVLDGMMLTDYDWTEYNHILTPQNVEDSMNRDAVGLFDGDIVYSLYDYGAQFTGGDAATSCTNQNSSGVATNPINIRNLKPQIKVKKVLQKILNQAEFTYESTFIDTTMTDLYMDINSGGEGNTTLTDPNFYRIDVQGEFNQAGTFTASVGVHTIIANNLIAQPDYMNASGQYDETTGIYSPSGNWNLSAFGGMVKLSAVVPSALQMTYTFGLYNITDDVFTQWESNIQTLNNGTGQTNLGGFIPQYANTFESGKQYKLIVTILSSSAPTQTVTILQSAFKNTPAADGYTGVAPGSGNLSVTPYDATTEYSVNANLPKVKALDLFTSLAKKFNLVIIPDEQNPTHLYIEPYSEWIEQGNNLDWTEKLDVSKDVQLKPTTDLQAKNLTFTDSKSEDFMNSMFESSSGRIYGTQYVDNTENDFGKDKEEIKTIFKPTITSLIPDTPIRYSIAYNEEGDNITCEPGIRLSFYCGYVLTDSNDGVQIYNETPESASSLSLTSYGLFQNYKDAVILPATECLSFMGEYTGALASPISMNSAYSVYWKRFIEETYSIEARILTGTFFLSALDIQTMNFNDIVFVKNEYFRINKISNYSLIGSSACQVELIKVQLVNILDVNGLNCNITPSSISSEGVVSFISTETGLSVTPTQDCCEAFGYTFAHGNCTQVFSGGGGAPGGGGHKGYSGDSLGIDISSLTIKNTIKGLNEVSGTFNNVHGSSNAVHTNQSNVNGFFNFIKTNSSGNTIKGDSNSIDSNTTKSLIQGDFNQYNPYSLNWTGASYEVYSRQTFKNNSIVGDYGIAVGSGESFISGGEDTLYNTVGRSGSGHLVKHGFTDDEETINIGQDGMFTYGTDFLYDQSTNFFRLEFPSMISFEINVVGHDRGTAASRSQEYTFRKYSGTILNTNNSGAVNVKDKTLDIQKETSNFTNYSFNIIPSFAPTDRPSGGGDLVYIDDGMFAFQIETIGATKLGIVDWTIDFKYTLVGLQNLGRASGQPIFTPTQITGCLLWVDAADPTTITHSSGDVSQWDDKSGNNYHLTQSTAAYEPTYSSVVPYPYIEFDGNNQVLGNTDAGLIGVSDGRNTMFVVFESANTTTSSPGQTLVGVNERGRQYYGMNINSTTAGAGGTAFMNKSTQDYSCNNSTIASTTKQVVIGTRNATDRIIYDQDGLTDTKTNSTDTAQDMFSIGASWETGRTPSADYTGKIYEVIVYDVVLSTAERNQVQNYLQTKWNT